jgi:hypothetical protein
MALNCLLLCVLFVAAHATERRSVLETYAALFDCGPLNITLVLSCAPAACLILSMCI